MVLLVGTGVYLNTLPNEFVLDDTPAILWNQCAHPPVDLEGIFTTNYWGNQPRYEHLTIYRPLATLSFALGELVHGPEPAGHHLVNALLHGLLSLLVFFLGLQMLDTLGCRDRTTEWGVVFAGLLFAVHPVHVEAVAGAVSRAEILAGVFVVSSLLCAVRARRPGTSPWGWWGGAALLFAFGLLSKENGVTALLMLVLVDIAVRFARKRDGAETGPLFSWPLLVVCVVALGGYLWLRASVLPGVLGGKVEILENPIVEAIGPGRWMTPFAVYLEACRLFVWPVDLSVDYTAHVIPLATSWLDPRGLLGLALFVLTLGGGILLARRQPFAALAIGLFLAGWSVVSHLAFPATVIFGERLLYLPSVGVCLAAGAGVAAVVRRFRRPAPRWAFVGIVGFALMASALLTVERNGDWHDEYSLYLSSLIHTPDSSRLQANVGSQLLNRGDLARAERACRRAIDIEPTNAAAWTKLAQALVLQKRFDEAEEAIFESLKRDMGSPLAFDNACRLRLAQHRYPEALAACEGALKRGMRDPVRAGQLRHIVRTLRGTLP